MAGKKSSKREFDWRAYTKPARLLTPEQELALADGVLRPVLDLALSESSVNLEIRARQAALYYRGASIARITGAEAPFSASVDAALRLARAERPPAEQLETWPLETAEQVTAFLSELGSLRAGLDAFAADEPPSARDALCRFAQANRQDAEAAELIVVDIEYQYGRRRFDLAKRRRGQAMTIHTALAALPGGQQMRYRPRRFRHVSG